MFYRENIIFILALILNITLAQAQQPKINSMKYSRSPYFSDLQLLYDVKFYFNDIEVSNTNSFINGKTSILVESNVLVMDTLVFEFDSIMNVDSVLVNSIRTNYLFENNLLKIILPSSLNKIKMLSAEIYYNGKGGGRESFFSGIMTRSDYYYGNSVTYSMSEPFQSIMWFPCKQDLTDKADSAWIFLTVKKGLKAGANGLVKEIEVNDSTVRYEWKTRYPTAYYLLSFSVSDYSDYSFNIDLPGIENPLPVHNYVYNHPLIMEREKELIDRTGDLLILYSEILGTYPFWREKYGHCMAPMGGGMEHQTMTTISTFQFELLAHELAHQWFGNYITCKTWSDVWINEGFASYLEYIAIEKLKTREEAQQWMINAQNGAKTYEQGSVFISNDEAHNKNRIFNTELSYKKGASILHMLRYEINNDNLFFYVLREFLDEFAFGSADGNDFLNILNRSLKKDFSWFFNQWYYGEGFPVFFNSWKQENDLLIISAKQLTSSSKTPFFKTHIDYKIIYEEGQSESLRVLFETDHQEFRIKTNKTVSEIILDPDNYILKASHIMEDYPDDIKFDINKKPLIKTYTLNLQKN